VADAIGQVLSLGVGVSLSPVPIIADVLLLGTPRARVNGPAFLLGWVIGLAVVGTMRRRCPSRCGRSTASRPAGRSRSRRCCRASTPRTCC
jgi:hypothetical protein